MSNIVQTTAEQLINAWGRFAEAHDDGDFPNDKGYQAAIDLANAVHQAGQAGVLGPVLAGTQTLFEQRNISETWDMFRQMVAMYAGQQEIHEFDPRTQTTTHVISRMFGIPIRGRVRDILSLAQGARKQQLTELLLESGALPKPGQVTLLGVVPCGAACEVGGNPEWMWRSSSAAQAANSHTSAAQNIMENIPVAVDDTSEDRIKLGAYVILGMHTSYLKEEDDLDDLGEADEAKEMAWERGILGLIETDERILIGYPDVVLDAGTMAMAWHLHTVFCLAKANEMNDGDEVPVLKTMFFYPEVDRSVWAIQAVFQDGKTVELDIFPADAHGLLDNIMGSLEHSLGVDSHLVNPGGQMEMEADSERGELPTPAPRRVLH